MAYKEFDHFDSVVSRMRKMLDDVSNATTQTEVSKLEREGLELMRELQFTAPRVWEDFVDVSRKRRAAISSGLVSPTKKQPQQPAVISEPKPKKKAKKGKK